AEPISVSTLSILIGKAKEDVQLVVNRLQSLLDIKTGCVQVIHKSVTDFLTSQSKIPGLYIDIGTTHYILSLQCMTLMVELLKKMNICNLDPFKLCSDIPNRKELQDQKIPEHLAYSCKYWVSHLISSGNHWIGNEVNRQKLLTDVCTKK